LILPKTHSGVGAGDAASPAPTPLCVTTERDNSGNWWSFQSLIARLTTISGLKNTQTGLNILEGVVKYWVAPIKHLYISLDLSCSIDSHRMFNYL